jgi:hypothetical protein
MLARTLLRENSFPEKGAELLRDAAAGFALERRNSPAIGHCKGVNAFLTPYRVLV